MLSNVSIFFLKYNMRNTNYSSKNEIIVPSDNTYLYYYQYLPNTTTNVQCSHKCHTLAPQNSIFSIFKSPSTTLFQHDQLLFDQKMPIALF